MEEIQMKDETLESLCARRSIRKYKPDQIASETLEAVLRAGTYAPSGMNRQSAAIVVVQDREMRDLLSRINAQIMGTDGDPFYGAPTVLVVFADSRCPTHVEDGSLVLGNLLNAAYAAGLGSCWIHRARQTFETPEGKSLLQKWGLDENFVGIGNCILGYADMPLPAPAPRREGFVIRN